MKNLNTRIFYVLLILFSFAFNGCAYELGKMIDDGTPDYKIINREDYKTIEIFEEVIIYKYDRTITKGRFIEIFGEYLTLDTNFGMEKVNMIDISNIELKSKKNASLTGLQIDIVLSILFLVISYQEGWE